MIKFSNGETKHFLNNRTYFIIDDISFDVLFGQILGEILKIKCAMINKRSDTHVCTDD